ncbi:MAG: flagellin [Alphaproteobacteria bacterium]|nr:flagellin [Alphaproteobacteria bacterium]
MSSLLTNQSAMVALSTLRMINKNLGDVQNQVSTGKRISRASDNAAIWAVSTVMDSDVKGFQAISDTLSLGSSTVAVASDAANQVTSLLQQIKADVVSAQESNVDRTKIQDDIVNLRDQISSIVDAAQFSGLNLLKGGGSVSFLSSLNRASNGTVTASEISVNKIDLTTTAQAFGTSGTGTVTATEGGVATAGTLADGETATITYTAATIAEGESFRVTLGGTNYDYVARDGDTLNDVVRHLAKTINDAGVTGLSATYTNVADPTTTDSVLSITNASGANMTIAEDGANDGTAGGDLGKLSSMDVTTDAGAAQALTDIEGLVQAGIDAAASFGSTGKRVDIQKEFVTTLMDALKSGIGALTDADMEEASARLQSLQVQQQLGVQALSIANRAPQILLNLFR